MLGVLFGVTQSSTFQCRAGDGLQSGRMCGGGRTICRRHEDEEGRWDGRWGAMVELVGERGGEGSGGTSLDD